MWQKIGTVMFGVLGVLLSAGIQLANGEVQPAQASTRGYTLQSMAVATAVFNTGQMAGNPATPPPPDVPFQILVGDCTVSPGTMIYLPVFVIDDSAGAPPGFPANVNNQKADAAFMNNYVFAAFGVQAFIVQVDGRTTILTDGYITGVKTPPLLDGTPPGTNYIVAAAFLTPLTPGTHTVSIGGLIAGTPVAFLSYTVKVK